jgi:hypothetical protein
MIIIERIDKNSTITFTKEELVARIIMGEKRIDIHRHFEINVKFCLRSMLTNKMVVHTRNGNSKWPLVEWLEK